jgi:hypothetical protein
VRRAERARSSSAGAVTRGGWRRAAAQASGSGASVRAQRRIQAAAQVRGQQRAGTRAEARAGPGAGRRWRAGAREQVLCAAARLGQALESARKQAAGGRRRGCGRGSRGRRGADA